MFSTVVIVLLILNSHFSFFDPPIMLDRNMHLVHLVRFQYLMNINRGDPKVQYVFLLSWRRWLPVVVFPSGASGNQGQAIQSSKWALIRRLLHPFTAYFLVEYHLSPYLAIYKGLLINVPGNNWVISPKHTLLMYRCMT